MSSVRMCDNPECGEIFSEAEEGWSVSQQTKIIEDGDGRRSTINMSVDLCPECSPDTKANAARLRERRKQNRINRLELTVGNALDDELAKAEREAGA